MKTIQSPIRVAIAEDIEMVLRGLESLLLNKGFLVAGTAKNGRELLTVVAKTKPDVVLTDVRMPEMDGITAVQELKRLHPRIGAVGLTQLDEEQFVVDMLKAGARGFLFKDENLEELYEALTAVHEGRTYYCSKVPVRLLRRIEKEDADPFTVTRSSFNALEISVIRLMCQDYNSREMAVLLNKSKDTIDKCRQRIMDKLGVRGVAKIIFFALKEGIWREGEE